MIRPSYFLIGINQILIMGYILRQEDLYKANGGRIMSENIVMARYENIEDAKEAYKILKKSTNSTNQDFSVSQVVLIQNVDGKMKIWDQHQDKLAEFDKTIISGVVGIVLGAMMGPFAGAVLGGVGAMIGSGFDIVEQNESEEVIYQMYSKIHEGDIVILAIVNEESELELNSQIGKLAEEIYRWDLETVKKQIEEKAENL